MKEKSLILLKALILTFALNSVMAFAQTKDKVLTAFGKNSTLNIDPEDGLIIYAIYQYEAFTTSRIQNENLC